MRLARSIAINPNYDPYTHATLVAALALTGHDAEAREALQRYLALPSTAAAQDDRGMEGVPMSQVPEQGGDPRCVEMNERSYDGLRKAGMPEE